MPLPSTAFPTPTSEQTPSTPGMRIRDLRLRLDLPQKVFARYLAVSQSTLSQIENGYYSPSYGSISRLAEKVPFNCNWLIRGEGEPFEDNTSPVATPQRGIPGVGEKAMAGYCARHRDETWAMALPRYSVPGFAREGDFRIFQALGDSMEPTIGDQDFMISERITTPLDSYVGQAVVCVLDDEILVKRLAQFSTPTGRMTASSDNPKYKAVEIDEEELLEVWHVTGRLTRTLAPPMANQDFRLRQLEAGYQELSSKIADLTADR